MALQRLPHSHEPPQHPEEAIVFTAVLDGIDMGPNDDGSSIWKGAVRTTPEIPRRIARDSQTSFLHPYPDQPLGFKLLRGVRGPEYPTFPRCPYPTKGFYPTL